MAKNTLLTKGNATAVAAILAALPVTGYFGTPVVQAWAAAVSDVRLELALHELRHLKEDRRDITRELRDFPDDPDLLEELDEVRDEIDGKEAYIDCLRAGGGSECRE